MGNGILTIPDSETWKHRRRLYDPAFKKRFEHDYNNYSPHICTQLPTSIIAMTGLLLIFTNSYLKSLLVQFNQETEKLIEQLKPLADGVTKVPMNLHFGNYTLDIISKVNHISCNYYTPLANASACDQQYKLPVYNLMIIVLIQLTIVSIPAFFQVGFGLEYHQQTDRQNMRMLVPMIIKGVEVQIRNPGFKVRQSQP